MKYDIKIDSSKEVLFNNHVDECVGTGRMGLALTKEYMEQLKEVQAEIGFKHIRGHGLFCDDMAIYQERKDWDGNVTIDYNFTYLDRVMDGYLSVGIRPFLELGFMPYKMASGDNTVFYWKGNTTPPKSYDDWCKLVTVTLRHLMDRYGADEVVTWPVEVWNEPNLPGFWKDANMEEYLVLFERTFYAIKELDSRFKIGGPAICGVEDVKHMTFFMDFLDRKKLPIDFITRHHYTSEQPSPVGHYGYIRLVELHESMKSVEDSRRIIDSYPDYAGIPMHITEFNTSYIPNAPIHDTNQNAAYVASLLAILGNTSDSYSYWTFGDVFEEWGVPFTPFHGGFGLLADKSIRKPTFYSFKFFKELRGKCVHKDDNAVVCLGDDGVYRGVLFNSRIDRTGEALDIGICVPAPGNTSGEPMDVTKCTLITKTVDENTCNPLKVWHDLGEPANPNMEQIALIKENDKPFIKTKVVSATGGEFRLDFNIAEFGLEYFELRKFELNSDRGYDYERVQRGEPAKED